MRKSFILLAAAAATTNAAPAFAQDETSFQGFWIGAHAGYDSIGVDDDSEDGVVYGISTGYDFRLGDAVIGVEAELSESSVSSTASDVFAVGDEIRLAAGRDIYAGFRVGLPLNDNLLMYGKAGYTNLRAKASYTLGNMVTDESSTSGGYRLGAGAELSLGRPFARIEYRYSHYGDFDDIDFEADRHQVMVTAGYRF